MNIYNVIFVSNSIKYAEELKRIAQFNDVINLTGVARGLHDFKIKMSQNKDIHIVLVSDELNNGTLEDVMNYLMDYDVIVFGIINHSASEDILDKYGISSVYEKDMFPSELVSFLQESLTAFKDDETPSTNVKAPEEIVETHHSRFEENYENPQRNQQTVSRTELYQNDSVYEPVQPIRQNKGVTTMGVIKPKVVCFTSAKGGVGKSALAMEVAACLAARAKEVQINMATRGAEEEVNAVLVDLNYAFGTVAATLPCVANTKNPPTLADWVIKLRKKITNQLSYEDKKELQSQKNPRYAPYIYKMNRNAISLTKKEVMELLVKEPKTGLYILPTISSNFDIAQIEEEFIELIVEELSRFFHAVILDTGNNFEAFTQTAFRISNEIYIVANPNVSVTVINKTLLKDSVDGLGIDKDKFRLVINHPQTNKQIIDDEGMIQSVGIPLAGKISFDENMLLAHDAGQFYAINNKKRPVSKDITLIANQILPLWNVAGATKKGGILKRLFGK